MNRNVYRIYFLTVLAVGFLFLGALGTFTAFHDPYWIWREQPPWLAAHQGHNRVLDTRLRHAKAMQILTRRPEHVILGSSRVYRGFDTDQGVEQGAYNLGLPRLRIAEAEAYARHLILFSPLKRLVLGLDYLMFDADEPFIAGFDPDLGTRKYVLTNWPASFITKQAFSDARLAVSNKTRGDGTWRWNGFRYSNDRDQASLQEVYGRFQSHRITEKQYSQLESLLELLTDSGVDVAVYLSPMSKPHLKHFQENGELAKFNTWRQRIAEITAEHEVLFGDFSTSSPFSDENVREHSTEFWVDSSHFKPVVGNWILNQMQVN